MSRLLVVGPGRSGTGYAARVLTASGVRCGHEQAVGIPQALRLAPPHWQRRVAESSQLGVWQARLIAPVVGLQVRDPLRVAASKYASGSYDDDHDPTRIYRAVLAYWAPDILRAPTVESRILRHIITATRLGLAAATLVWRVEDGVPVETLARQARLRHTAARVPVPVTVNWKGPPGTLAEARDRFSRCPEWADVIDLYRRWYPDLPTGPK